MTILFASSLFAAKNTLNTALKNKILLALADENYTEVIAELGKTTAQKADLKNILFSIFTSENTPKNETIKNRVLSELGKYITDENGDFDQKAKDFYTSLLENEKKLNFNMSSLVESLKNSGSPTGTRLLLKIADRDDNNVSSYAFTMIAKSLQREAIWHAMNEDWDSALKEIETFAEGFEKKHSNVSETTRQALVDLVKAAKGWQELPSENDVELSEEPQISTEEQSGAEEISAEQPESSEKNIEEQGTVPETAEANEENLTGNNNLIAMSLVFGLMFLSGLIIVIIFLRSKTKHN